MFNWLFGPKIEFDNKTIKYLIRECIKTGQTFEQDKQVFKETIKQLKEEKLEQKDILNQLMQQVKNLEIELNEKENL